MIDAINTYSSYHAGRPEQKNKSDTTFGRFYYNEADYFISKSLAKTSKAQSYVVVAGCAVAMSMIVDTLCAAKDLAQGNMLKVGEIMRNACAMGIIAVLLYGGIRLIENFAEQKTKV